MNYKNKLYIAITFILIFNTQCNNVFSEEENNYSNNAPVSLLLLKGQPIKNVTINPVIDFYINRSMYTDTNPYTLSGWGYDSQDTYTEGTTFIEVGISNSRPYQSLGKLIFNFNISALSGAVIQSATFRIYETGSNGTTQNAILENIFYGSTDTFPGNPRNYNNEMGGYIVTPAITSTATTNAAGWKTFDVKAKLQADINAGRNNSQFRLTHPNETSLVPFRCYWSMVNNTSNKPELAVVYTK